MKRLDLYVGRIMLGALVASLAFLLFVSVLLDLLNRLPEYAEKADKQGWSGLHLAGYLAVYYGRQVPVFFTMVAPFSCVIAGMFTVARLHGASEIVPMLFVGRSIHRVLAPVLWAGVVSGALMMSTWQWVMPHVGSELATQASFLRQGSSELKAIVHEQRGDESKKLYVASFDPVAKRASGLAMVVQGVLVRDEVTIEAPRAAWDAERGDWRLEGGRRWANTDDGARIERPVEWLERPDVTPEVLVQQSREAADPETMSYDELLRVMEMRPHNRSLRMTLHRHFTAPLGCVLLLLLALPMAVRYERGSRVDRILAAIGLCGAYLLVDLTCQRLGTRNLMHPVVAAWTPTIVFGSLGLVLYGGTKT